MTQPLRREARIFAYPSLTALELDALTELVNIGVSRAANALRGLVGEQVLLTVPSLADALNTDAPSASHG
jgi:chemotaxis protein CheY-P-specific phosphatase CheC